MEENRATHYAVQIKDATRCADKIELYFHEAFLTDEEDSISIEIIADNSRLEAKDFNFRPPSKRKKVIVPQANFNRPQRTKARHHIKGLHNDLCNIWISCKHKWRSHVFKAVLQRMKSSLKELRKVPYNTWSLCKHKSNSFIFNANR